MQQPFDKFLMFQNRLGKVFKHLGKQARKQDVHCYRIYDHDLPEFPFIIEIYGQYLYVSEYKRKHNLADEQYEAWLEGCQQVMSEVLGIDRVHIFMKMRQRKEGRQGQYQKLDEEKNEMVVQEGGLGFIVNLSDYLDTGLFLDHRITRKMVKEESEGKRILNLFCYTGSFSVYAAAGGAISIHSVDLSKTYLNWTEKNMELNFPGTSLHRSIHADVKKFLKEAGEKKYDLIVMDPPTFSNSKRMEGILDIQKDHAELINDCMKLLSANGILYFSTNYTRFILEEDKIDAGEVKDITRKTTPFDFEGKLKRQCFRMMK